MSATDLRFKQRQPASLDLRFGALDNVGPEFMAIGMAASLPSSLTGSLPAKVVLIANLAASLPAGMAASLPTKYDNAVNRSPHLRTTSNWQNAAPADSQAAFCYDVAPKIEASIAAPISQATRREGRVQSAWRPMLTAPRPEAALPWSDALRRRGLAGFEYSILVPVRPVARFPYAEAQPRAVDLQGSWQDRLRNPRPGFVLSWDADIRQSQWLTFAAGSGRKIRRYVLAPWQVGRHPLHGVSTRPGKPPVAPPCYIPAVPVHLRFADPQPASLDLRFRCPKSTPGPVKETVVVPVLRTYIVASSLSLVLASNGMPIPVRDINVGIDWEGCHWGWSASVPASFLPVLKADPGDAVELIAEFNDIPFRLTVESIKRDRRFAQATLSISGRGRAAWLADPYAEVVTRDNAEAMTAQQLMATALTENGVSLGWSLDWQITDWLVPAGVWSHTGTALQACVAIAEAAGAYIQSDPVDQILHVLPRYPAAPWHWAELTPDFDLPEDACVTEGLEYQDKPAYNAIYVSGQRGGVLGHVVREGMGGGKVKPMVTDPLITHADAARQRGIAELSDTGRIKTIDLSLQILEETGIILPGQIGRYTEQGNTHIGIVRGVKVTSQFPKQRQTITVESHDL